MTDWQYNRHGVLYGPDETQWWHVLNRYRDVDNGNRFYRLADATHTEYKDRARAEWIESAFHGAEWSTSTKPAAERGWRINGCLVGPGGIEWAKDRKCVHELECPQCSEDSPKAIDVIVDHSEQTTTGECRICGHSWVEERHD